MGNRVKGRPKKSSIKATLSSSAGSKRKLSRFGKRRKKHHAGLEATLIGRSKVLTMLQITIKDFRRLCILKGIYPREPLGKVPGNKKKQFYYHIKDIRAIAHEPILEKFREFRAFMKKIRRAAGRQERDEAVRKNSILPEYSLHHLVKERYPRFVDALGDLDDALTLVYLFATLPSERNLKPKYIGSAKRLAAAWGAYCATNAAITKSFISVKGVYMEASIHNTDIRWIIPHAFTQYLPSDVDFRVMNTFFEFYETLLNFVLFKLYNDVNIRYPFSVQDYGKQVVGNTSSLLSANLRALFNSVNQTPIVSDAVAIEAPATKSTSEKSSKELIKRVDAALNQLNSDDEDDEDDDESVDMAGQLQDALTSTAEEDKLFGDRKLDDESVKRQRLFQGLAFFLSREIPRGYIELVCLAFGGKVGWEGDDSPISMKDPSITHHIVDRPQLPKAYENLPKSREFVQPQWILDCSNFLFLLPIARYAIGASLPPHLSPWVDDEEEGYTPKYAQEIEKLKNGETLDASDEERDAETDRRVEEIDQGPKASDNESAGEEEEEEEEEETSDNEAVQARLERKRKKDEQEAHNLAKTMMSRKATHLYKRMQHGIAKKQETVDKLHQRRKELDKQEPEIKGKEKDESGKTPLKQKVERLRKERKKVEKTYTDTGGTMKKSKKSRKN